MGVVKAYLTRVGSGGFPTELHNVSEMSFGISSLFMFDMIIFDKTVEAYCVWFVSQTPSLLYSESMQNRDLLLLVLIT